MLTVDQQETNEMLEDLEKTGRKEPLLRRKKEK